MAKHFNIVSLLLHHPMKNEIFHANCITCSIHGGWYVLNPFLWSPALFYGPGKFTKGPGSCSTKGWQGTFFLPSTALTSPWYTLVYWYQCSFNVKHLPLGVSVMALRDGEPLSLLSICCPATPGLLRYENCITCSNPGRWYILNPFLNLFLWSEVFHFSRTWEVYLAWLPLDRKCFSLGYVLWEGKAPPTL